MFFVEAVLRGEMCLRGFLKLCDVTMAAIERNFVVGVELKSPNGLH